MRVLWLRDTILSSLDTESVTSFFHFADFFISLIFADFFISLIFSFRKLETVFGVNKDWTLIRFNKQIVSNWIKLRTIKKLCVNKCEGLNVRVDTLNPKEKGHLDSWVVSHSAASWTMRSCLGEDTNFFCLSTTSTLKNFQNIRSGQETQLLLLSVTYLYVGAVYESCRKIT